MDVIVTQSINRTRRYRVNDADDTQDAVRKVSALDGPALPEGITRETEGESENVAHSTQPAPKRAATPPA